MAADVTTVDDYLAALPAEQRQVLEELRTAIREAAPQAEERIAYGLPMYRHHGDVVGFGAFQAHCSLFATSSTVAERFAAELEPYDIRHTTIRFSPETPLPADLVQRIVRFRIAENEARG